jgi:hypothetical protein
MSGTVLHTGFDVLAWLAAAGSLSWLTRCMKVRFPPSVASDLTYIAVLIFGAGVGAVLAGTANLWLSQQPGFAGSVEGAIAGGIAERPDHPVRYLQSVLSRRAHRRHPGGAAPGDHRMSNLDQRPTEPRPRRNPFVSFLLFVLGAILLLPGLCSLVFVGIGGADGAPTVMALVFVCLLIGVGGIVMIVKAFRR